MEPQLHCRPQHIEGNECGLTIMENSSWERELLRFYKTVQMCYICRAKEGRLPRPVSALRSIVELQIFGNCVIHTLRVWFCF